MTTQSSKLDNIRKLRGIEQIKAASEYIADGEAKVGEARSIRDHAIATLAREIGLAETAKQVGLSVSSIKMIRGRA